MRLVLLSLALGTVLSPVTSGAQTEARAHFVVWSPHGLPSNTAARIEKAANVEATTIRAGIGWLTRSRQGGEIVDGSRDGYSVPLEIAFIEPRGFASFADAEDRNAIRDLGDGEVLLPSTSARLRSLHEGARMTIDGDVYRVVGIISNASAQSYEAIARGKVPGVWRAQLRAVAIEAPTELSKKELRRKLERIIDDDFRLARERDVGYLRYGTGVRSNLEFKKAFGEFQARVSRSGAIPMKPRWVERNIASYSVPILGTVTCHEDLAKQLRGALREVKRKGLSHTIRPDEYAGCYNPRYTATHPGLRISRHTWGIALDINTSNNGFGSEPHQDPRLVRIMEKWGFVWGGTWVVPDGMHFEWDFWP